MNKLPRVFVNKIDTDFNNSQMIFYGHDRNDKKESREDVLTKINKIFTAKNHVYKSLVKISYVDKTEEKIIVGNTNKELITLNGELIPIKEIIDIEKI